MTKDKFSAERIKKEYLEMVFHPDPLPVVAPAPQSERPKLFSIRGAAEWCELASKKENPKELWLDTWYEGEVCCLFADSNLGKSIYAVQIARHIASQGMKVLYFDFELSEKQFQLRYTDEQGRIYPFPPTLLRAEIDPDVIAEIGLEQALIDSIEDAACALDTKIIIIDNITYLNTLTESADAASQLMMSLLRLKKKYGWSVLALAHTPKRAAGAPLTQNDLAGSKRLFNFFDSVFAIGKSQQDESLRYIKQLKVRHGAFRYDGDNVIVCEIVKEDAFLQFKTLRFSAERAHIRELDDKELAAKARRVLELHERGDSIRTIVSKTGLSRYRVHTLITKSKTQSKTPD